MDYGTLFNNGVAIGCLVYFMYITQTTIKQLTTAITSNTEIIHELKDRL